MRAAILSDVHANREALEAVEARLAGLRVDRVFFLGDAVGYNADPRYCLDRIAALASFSVRGNHDKTVADPANLDWFNEVAREALVWTRRQLNAAGPGAAGGAGARAPGRGGALGAVPRLARRRGLLPHPGAGRGEGLPLPGGPFPGSRAWASSATRTCR